jgi:hypothetical protein
MPEKADKSTSFWQELKRRNVLHVMTVYIAAAFGFLELADIVSGPLNLTGKVIQVVMVFAVIGFPIAFLLAWFFPKSPESAPWEGFAHTDSAQDLVNKYFKQDSKRQVIHKSKE